jgi:hypothetical protein
MSELDKKRSIGGWIFSERKVAVGNSRSSKETEEISAAMLVFTASLEGVVVRPLFLLV